MAEIGELKYIPPSIPTRPTKPVSKSGDQEHQSSQQQSDSNSKQQHDDKQDNDDGLPHIDEYV